MSEQPVILSVEGGIATLTLNRPKQMNSFNADMQHAFQEAIQKVNQDRAIRVLVLTGEGRGFSAGQDLKADEVAFDEKGNPPDFETVIAHYYKPLILSLRTVRVPTIAAVNGVAAGAGVSLAMACDITIATESASFILAFSQIGLVPDSGASWNLAKYVGQARATGLAFLGNRLPATTAKAWGLIWDVVADDQFEVTVNELAERMAAMPTNALVNIRHLIEKAYCNPLATHLDEEAAVMGELGRSGDYREGVTAFIEKRQPNFKGD